MMMFYRLRTMKRGVKTSSSAMLLYAVVVAIELDSSATTEYTDTNKPLLFNSYIE